MYAGSTNDCRKMSILNRSILSRMKIHTMFRMDRLVCSWMLLSSIRWSARRL